MRKHLIFLALSLISVVAYSQVEVLDNNPSGLNWREINSEHFKIIFPKSYEKEALRITNTLETIHEPESQSLGTSPKKISLILQNQNSTSNGFVTIGPRRSEFFTSSPQNYNFLGTGEWMTLLATHEYRHIVQYASSNVGLTKAMRMLFGQYTQAGLTNLAVPQWFWEGDATAIETAYTRSGRGRLPNFDRTFRANLLEGRRYNYDKAHLRSFKDFVPNHYVLGYHFVNHVLGKTGEEDVWKNVTNRAFRWPIIPMRFSSSLKKYTGKNLKENYNDMLDELDDLWKKQIDNLELTPYETVIKRKKTVYTDYSNPMPMSDGRILCLRSGLGYISQFVAVDENGNEEVLHTPGNINASGTFSLSGNLLVWNEYRYNPRYQNQTYSVIEAFNTLLKKNVKLTSKTRFHSATLSPEGAKILTVEAQEEGNYQIVVVDASYGNEIKRFKSEPNTFYNLPSWSKDGSKVLVAKINKQGKSLVLINYETGVESELIAPSHENIGNAFLTDDYLVYHSAYSGLDNIYAMELSSGKRFQITSSKYGAYNASISHNGKTMYYNDHTVNGLDIVKIPFDPKTWTPLEKVAIDEVAYYEPYLKHEDGEHLLDNVSATEYDIKKHSMLKGLINPHSWGPLLTTNINELEAGLLSQDVLSTTSLYAGVVYDAVEQTTYGVGRASYQGLWSIIDVEATKGQRNTPDYSTWDETSIEAGLRIPLNFTSGKFRQNVTLKDNIGFRKVENYGVYDANTLGRLVGSVYRIDTTDQQGNVVGSSFHDIYTLSETEIDDGKMVFNHFEFIYSTVLKRSVKDINPKLGFIMNFETFNTLNGDFSGTLSAINTRLFLPGFFKHHSLYLVASGQNRRMSSAFDSYSFQNRIFRVRGHSFYNDKKAKTFRANYSLPIWCPDLAIGPLMYIKRFKLNGFYDNGSSAVPVYRYLQSDLSIFQEFEVEVKYKSFGAELTMDFNVLRLPYDLEIGVRYVYAAANSQSNAVSTFELMLGGISF